MRILTPQQYELFTRMAIDLANINYAKLHDFPTPEEKVAYARILMIKGFEVELPPMESVNNISLYMNSSFTINYATILGMIYSKCPEAVIDIVESTDKHCKIIATRNGVTKSFEKDYDTCVKEGFGMGNKNWKKIPATQLLSRTVGLMNKMMFKDITSGLMTPEDAEAGYEQVGSFSPENAPTLIVKPEVPPPTSEEINAIFDDGFGTPAPTPKAQTLPPLDDPLFSSLDDPFGESLVPPVNMAGAVVKSPPLGEDPLPLPSPFEESFPDVYHPPTEKAPLNDPFEETFPEVTQLVSFPAATTGPRILDTLPDDPLPTTPDPTQNQVLIMDQFVMEAEQHHFYGSSKNKTEVKKDPAFIALYESIMKVYNGAEEGKELSKYYVDYMKTKRATQTNFEVLIDALQSFNEAWNTKDGFTIRYDQVIDAFYQKMKPT